MEAGLFSEVFCFCHPHKMALIKTSSLALHADESFLCFSAALLKHHAILVKANARVSALGEAWSDKHRDFLALFLPPAAEDDQQHPCQHPLQGAPHQGFQQDSRQLPEEDGYSDLSRHHHLLSLRDVLR